MKSADCLRHWESVFLPVSLDLCLNRSDCAHGVVLSQPEIFNCKLIFFHQVEHSKVSKDVNLGAADCIPLRFRYSLVKLPFFHCKSKGHFPNFCPSFCGPTFCFNGSFRFTLPGAVNQRNYPSDTRTQHNATCDSCKIHVEPPSVLSCGKPRVSPGEGSAPTGEAL